MMHLYSTKSLCTVRLINVLILVVMDDALVRAGKFVYLFFFFVLILVVMDDALVLATIKIAVNLERRKVLILVVMDDALVLETKITKEEKNMKS